TPPRRGPRLLIRLAKAEHQMTKAAVAVIVVAAGGGRRLGHSQPKAFVPLGGSTILANALDGVRRSGAVAQVIVVAPQDYLQPAREITQQVFGAGEAGLVRVIAGGAERTDSVAAGLRALAPEVTTVLIHDAARALTP